MKPDAEKLSTSNDNSPSKTLKAPSTSTSYEFRRLRTRLRGQFQQLRRTSNLTGYQLNYIAKIHIDIFIFANKYLTGSMRRKWLDYLHYEIDNVKPCPTLEKIVKMPKYTHDCTTPYEPVGMSDIRGLIYRYASCHIRDVAVEPFFQRLIRDRLFIASNLFRALTL
ncbi:hypothetical protein DPV78_006207 [Talaromyces pinophilus]|nr:hypothetical protein DPV78_006207 [Talaromyces pinophilus]